MMKTPIRFQDLIHFSRHLSHPSSRVKRSRSNRRRRLRLESLENRRVLASFVVSTLSDVVDANDGVLSLREAIASANTAAGPDVITFDSSLTAGGPQSVLLTGTELTITEAITITGPTQGRLTIDAQGDSRVVNVTAASGDVTLNHLTLTGGMTLIDNLDDNDTRANGAGIRFLSTGTLALNNVVVSGNSTEGELAAGGGIFSLNGNVTLSSSTVSGNGTNGEAASGGGIHSRSGAITLIDSKVSGNTTGGFRASGGGIATYTSSVTITRSTVSGNSTSGESAYGGGVYGDTVSVTSSTISGNSTLGASAEGGGISAGNVSTLNSTISGNGTSGVFAYGGGIAASRATISFSTITGNSVSGAGTSGGGIYILDFAVDPALIVTHSIIAQNSADGLGDDFSPSPDALPDVRFSLIGNNSGTDLVESQTADSNGNLVGTPEAPINPLLGGVLSDNGGTTQTHALLVGSPAIDAGDPNGASPSANDQRGPGFVRVFGGEIDIGAFELSVVSSFDFGDAPEGYPVTLAQNGARHAIGAIHLGNAIDAETNGTASAAADGDAGDDGVEVLASLLAVATSGTSSSLRVTTSQPAKLDAWIDFDQVDNWNGANEQILTSIDLAAGENIVPFNIPAAASVGSTTARFRLSTAGGLAPTGAASNGEVEDYLVTIIGGTSPSSITANIVAGVMSILRDTDRVVLRSGSTVLFSAPTANVSSFDIVGSNEDDLVTLDFSSGFVIPDTGIKLAGSGGDNVLAVTGNAVTLDLTDPKTDVSNFARVGLLDAAASRLILDRTSVNQLSPTQKTVLVTIDPDDEIMVKVPDNWLMVDPIVVDGKFVLVAQNQLGGNETIQADTGRPFKNFVQSGDINNDGNISAGDALAVIFELNQPRFSNASGVLSDPLGLDPWPGIYFDANGDGLVSASDALKVINDLFLDDLNRGSGEQATERIEVKNVNGPPQKLDSLVDTAIPFARPVRTPPIAVIATARIARTSPHTEQAALDAKMPNAVDQLLSDQAFLGSLIDSSFWMGDFPLATT